MPVREQVGRRPGKSRNGEGMKGGKDESKSLNWRELFLNCSLGVAAHTFNPETPKAEAGGSL